MIPKVGAGVITRNHENYIEESINALLNQSIDLFEIIVVDDCSDDKTYSKLEKIAKKYSKVRIIRNSRQLGPSSSSNLALRNLSSDFFIYTSGDDISKPNRAQFQLNFLLHNPEVDCVVSNVDLMIENPNFEQGRIPIFLNSKLNNLELYRSLFWNQNYLNASSAFFRKNIKDYELFSDKYLFLQDYDLWLRLSLAGKISMMQDKLLWYRVTDSSLSQIASIKDTQENLRLQYELFDILKNSLDAMDQKIFEKVFSIFIRNFTKVEMTQIDKNLLVHFILLSHNNVAVRALAQYNLENDNLSELFWLELSKNMRITRELNPPTT
jgi:glycosyltransferase involved in cell wall biosynthesis